MRRTLAIVLVLSTLACLGASPGKKHRPKPPAAGSSIAQVREWVAKEYPKITFVPEGIGADVWVEFFTEFAILAPDLPATVEGIDYIGSGGVDWAQSPDALLMTNGPPGGHYWISLNPVFHTSLKDIEERTARDEKSGFHPKGASRKGPLYPHVAHELAHLLERQTQASDPTLHARWARIIRENDPSLICKYATTDAHEAFAEAVVAWHVQDESEQSPLTKAVGEELRALGIAR